MLNAAGTSPGQSILSGLTQRKGDAGAFGKGQAMSAAAGLQMDRDQQNLDFGLQQMKADSQLRQQGNQNMNQRAMNEVDARMQKGALASRRQVFNTGMNFDYAALQKRKNMAFQQSLFNALTSQLD